MQLRAFQSAAVCATAYYCMLLCITVHCCVLLCTTGQGIIGTTVYCCVLRCAVEAATAYYCVLLCTFHINLQFGLATFNACGLQALAWSQGGNDLRQSSGPCRARSSHCVPLSTIVILLTVLKGGKCCIRISCHSFIEICKSGGGRAGAQPPVTSRE